MDNNPYTQVVGFRDLVRSSMLTFALAKVLLGAPQGASRGLPFAVSLGAESGTNCIKKVPVRVSLGVPQGGATWSATWSATSIGANEASGASGKSK